ncbi:hypothetical protein STAL104432_30985 [Streptomyces albus]
MLSPASTATSTASGQLDAGSHAVMAARAARLPANDSALTVTTHGTEPRSAARPRSGAESACAPAWTPVTMPTWANEPVHSTISSDSAIGRVVTVSRLTTEQAKRDGRWSIVRSER